MEQTAKILLCVENGDERRRMSDALMKGGYRSIDECMSGDRAISMLTDNIYDIVITDLWLSGIDGIGLIRNSANIGLRLCLFHRGIRNIPSRLHPDRGQ